MTTQEKRAASLKGAREKKAANQRDREDRETIEKRLRALVFKERPDVSPKDVEFTFTGDLSDVIIFIPEKKKRSTAKIAHRLKPGV